LIRGVQANRPAAWQRLVEKATPLADLWCRRAGVASSDVDDVVQEVFAAAWSHIAAFRPDRAGVVFPAWLRGIARHKIADYFRRSAHRVDAAARPSLAVYLPLEDESLPDEERCLCGHLQKALEEAQSEFEARTWEGFWETTVEEQPAAEVGARLGMTAGAVRQAKHKVLQRLREKLPRVA
jgi:RNA polymerase sigma-70 factor (ECF subfamily)